MTTKIARNLRIEFGPIISVAVKTKAPLFWPEAIRLVAPSKDRAYQMLDRIMFSHVRIRLFDAARFTWKKLDSTVDPEPLRFFIPFFFCEPFKLWYKFAPFRVNIHKCNQPLMRVELLTEAHRDFKFDTTTNSMEPKESWRAQAVSSLYMNTHVRPTYSISFAWSK